MAAAGGLGPRLSPEQLSCMNCRDVLLSEKKKKRFGTVYRKHCTKVGKSVRISAHILSHPTGSYGAPASCEAVLWSSGCAGAGRTDERLYHSWPPRAGDRAGKGGFHCK